MRTLKIISFHLLLPFVCSFDLQCEWNLVNQKSCLAKNLILESPDQVVKSVNGDTTTVLEDVFGFWVKNQTCHYFPQNIATFMPNLKWLEFEDSGLRRLSKFDLAPFTKLTSLSFRRNKLQYLDGDLFEQNTKIVAVNLEDNNLVIINGPILEPLKRLKQISLNVQCLQKQCLLSHCISEFVVEFNKKCEFDSIYPGFTNYFRRLKHIAESCNDV